ncbi:carbohydrate ABC transporter permease [Corynebacterium bovis]|uniref:Multiple sugar transport system permease protein n=8 Tax=Corynebacterium bovis TaxID=36808 RepID=A0A8H9YBK1_9CORY|nr:sugar ABC transporter permease [Corynebacterium bovis]MBB3115644.1 multiple sugar transport system permease protein [Corynebacterium bovis DSM 20582 = CIP 54.80]WJY77069.1 Trehalose transport system permease protein SugA [Corynebacterium bovis DSM 20582 = CIP 54.80]
MKPRTGHRPRRDLRALWLVGPAMLVLAVVIGYPVVRAVGLSFEANKHLDPETGMFVTGGFAGVEHYLYWLTQRCMSPSGEATQCAPGQLATDFWPAVAITLFFVVVTVALETCLGMAMALVMNRSFLGRGLLRAAVLVPWAIPTAVTAKLWQFIFADQGIANSLLGTQIHWTTDPWAARAAVIVADVWKTAPFMALLILAGLQMVPQGVYEAARVDGASRWQQFTRITLPLIRPALMVAVLFRTLDALRMYDLPVIMISGSSNSPTAVISQLVITDTKSGNAQSASALSTLIFLFVFAVAFVMVRFLGADVAGTGDRPRRRWFRGRRGSGPGSGPGSGDDAATPRRTATPGSPATPPAGATGARVGASAPVGTAHPTTLNRTTTLPPDHTPNPTPNHETGKDGDR